MATVIPGKKTQTHTINKYNFKVLDSAKIDREIHKNQSSDNVDSENEVDKPKIEEVDSSALSNSSKESLIESLMQKTDEMSSNFVKLQMRLEAKEEEFAQALIKAKEEAFAEGSQAGKAEAYKEIDTKVSGSVDMFATSVKKLETSAQEFESALEGIKKELINAALDISKEVIKVELSHNSNEVAKILSTELIKELQSASKVTLKVNPKNHGVISELTGKLEHINVVSDSAVSEGGVIIISDAGNIDAQISKRFERVKRAALSE